MHAIKGLPRRLINHSSNKGQFKFKKSAPTISIPYLLLPGAFFSLSGFMRKTILVNINAKQWEATKTSVGDALLPKSAARLERCLLGEVRRIGLFTPSLSNRFLLHTFSLCGSALPYKVFDFGCVIGQLHGRKNYALTAHHWMHSGKPLSEGEKDVQPQIQLEGSSVFVEGTSVKVKRKKLKGKRAVVRWLKLFRWKKKREYQRMTEEEQILYKLNKARKKEKRLIESLEKIEPKESSEAKHDPEILTPEEHFYFLKMGLKSKNYVPVGRRGIYQGVILNMHLHWKKHQTLQVIVKTFTPEEVKEIAAELARLSGGIVLDIHEENTIIMYRGKNYAQPPTEIMSPRITLPRKKALDKSKYRDALRGVRRCIPRYEQELELLRTRIRNKEATPSLSSESIVSDEKLKEMIMDEEDENKSDKDGPLSEDTMLSDSEDLSDMFESDLDVESEEDEPTKPLYLHTFDKFPVLNKEPEDFEEQLKKISSELTRPGLSGQDKVTPELDEIDQIFLRAATLLKRKQ